jgi:hypothetical protein
LKKLITICLVCLGLIAANANATLYVETFSSDNAGWLSADQSGTTLSADYHSSAGNPGGYISCSLTSNAPLIFGLEPSDVWGGYDRNHGRVEATWGDMTGDMLTADFKINDTLTAQDGKDPMVRFYLGDSSCTYYITKDAYSWNPNNDTSWTTHQVALLADNFVCEAGSDSFGYVVAHSNDIGLQFGPSMGQSYTGVCNLGFAGNGTTLMLDNFGTVSDPYSTNPEPATVGLLGLGGLTLLRRKK